MKLKTLATLALSAVVTFTATSSFAGEVIDRIIQNKTFNVGSRESSVPYSEKPQTATKDIAKKSAQSFMLSLTSSIM